MKKHISLKKVTENGSKSQVKKGSKWDKILGGDGDFLNPIEDEGEYEDDATYYDGYGSDDDYMDAMWSEWFDD